MQDINKIKLLSLVLILIIVVLISEFIFFYSQKPNNNNITIIKSLKIDSEYKSVFENKKEGTYIFETDKIIEVGELQNISSNLHIDEKTKSSKILYLFRPNKFQKKDNLSKKQIEYLNPIVSYKKTKNAEYIYLYSNKKVIKTYYKDKSTFNQWTIIYNRI